jgi:hypothetical protein
MNTQSREEEKYETGVLLPNNVSETVPTPYTEGASNLVTSGLVNTETAVKFILNVGKFYGSGIQYLGVDIGALTLTPCHATEMCDLFKIDDVQLSPQGGAVQVECSCPIACNQSPRSLKAPGPVSKPWKPGM